MNRAAAKTTAAVDAPRLSKDITKAQNQPSRFGTLLWTPTKTKQIRKKMVLFRYRQRVYTTLPDLLPEWRCLQVR
jgi:hypothetical protein